MVSKKNRLPTYESPRSLLQNMLIGVMVGAFCMLVTSSVASQVFAERMQYSSYLGEPLFTFGRWPFYLPVEWLIWGFKYSDLPAVHHEINEMIVIATAGGIASALLGVLATFLSFNRTKGMEALHGDAHWCSAEEVDRTGLLGSEDRPAEGVYVGSVMLDRKGETITPTHASYLKRYVDRMKDGKLVRDFENRPLVDPSPEVVLAITYLRDNGPTHILVFAPTRSGKGRGLIIPTLFSWKGSTVVSDQKGENYALTGEMRRRAGQRVGKFAPTCADGSGWSWNPLDEIRKFTLRDVADAQNIFSMIVDPENKGMEDHFVSRAWELLTGLGLHFIYSAEEKDKSLTGMAMYLSDPTFESDIQMWERMLNAVHDPEGVMGWTDAAGNPTKTHPMVANAAKSMLNTPDEERGSVLSSAKRCLTLFLDPLVAMNTRRSDFLMRDLMTLDDPVSLYYVPTEEDKDRLVPISRLFFSMVIRRNATQMHEEAGRMVGGYKHRMLLLIDEFPALRKMEIIQDGLAYVAGYGIKMMLICQDLRQLRDVYGENETIVAGCHIRIAYGPTDETTAQRLETMVGTTTVMEDSENLSANRMGMSGGSVSISRQKTSRPLMTVGEFMTLSMEDMVVFVANNQPIYGRKIKYDEVDQFNEWSRLGTPSRSETPRKHTAVAVKVKADKAAADEKSKGEAATGTTDVLDAAKRAVAGEGSAAALSAEEKAAVKAILDKDFLLQEIIAVRAFDDTPA